MKIGDKVRIISFGTLTKENFPSLPDIVGKEAHITYAGVYHPDDDPVYILELTSPVKQGVVPEGENGMGYEPTEWFDRTDWVDLGECLELIKECE